MKQSEDVTFGTSGLDRAGHLRNNAEGLAFARSSGAPIIPMWRGKPMVTGTSDTGSVRLALRREGDAVLREPGAPPVLLGLDADGETPIFAQDISGWHPEDLDEAAVTAFLDPSVQAHPSEANSGAAFRELRGIMTQLTRRDAELAATARAVLTWHATHRFCANCGIKSEPTMAGWQRDCPACGRHHFPRTDPVVIMLITYGEAVLVGRSPGWPEGMYSLLAGFAEPGETIEAAVRREVYEETGVRVGQVDYLSSQPWPFPASLMFGCSGVATSTEITPDPEEIEDARWVSRSEMLDVFAGAHPDIRAPREGAIAHFLLQRWLSNRLE
ncbi:NAD(+) diphosphatase [Gymnodinialimonas sp. 2305UL16-5]|uniref:NAD(+) diphosphatase n=1 Tax=Gymnodinialimonas mytili TaxID=3126503 RepID=UPI0030994813